jgi:hypothetical protein
MHDPSRRLAVRSRPRPVIKYASAGITVVPAQQMADNGARIGCATKRRRLRKVFLNDGRRAPPISFAWRSGGATEETQ